MQLKQAGEIIQATTGSALICDLCMFTDEHVARRLASAAVLDGEIVALDENGYRVSMVCATSEQKMLFVFYAFDLLYLDGYDLSLYPSDKTQRALEEDSCRNIIPDAFATRTTLVEVVNAYSKKMKH